MCVCVKQEEREKRERKGRWVYYIHEKNRKIEFVGRLPNSTLHNDLVIRRAESQVKISNFFAE